MTLRLTPDKMRMLTEAADYTGITRHSFVETAVMAEVADVLERRHSKLNRERVLKGKKMPPEKEREREMNLSAAPAGLGLSKQWGEENHDTHAAPAPVQTVAPAPGAVVVNVGNTNTAGDFIERLAAFVVTGTAFDRESRLRTAVSVLKSSGTDEEQKQMVERLDAAIAVKLSQKPGGGESLLRTAKMTFDKVAHIFGRSD